MVQRAQTITPSMTVQPVQWTRTADAVPQQARRRAQTASFFSMVFFLVVGWIA
jgi:hypothetical protein